MNRRKFLATTSLAGSGFALNAFAPIPQPEPVSSNAGFGLQVLATNWGFNGSVDSFCEAARKEGYDGIEMWWPADAKAQGELFNALAKHGLAVGFLCGGSQADWKQHLATFTKAIDEAAHNKVQKPLYINCHSGRDHFNVEHNQLFIDHTLKVSKDTGIRICHETHRGRILYSAPIARSYMEKNPDLKLTLDISHWCNVHESLLQDQQETVELALSRTEHIHTRVGHAEGPQVSDPRAPEWQYALLSHLKWWDTVIARKKKAGEMMTLLTEFGPADYMWTLPYTRQPLASQWEINVHMMHLLKTRWL